MCVPSGVSVCLSSSRCAARSSKVFLGQHIVRLSLFLTVPTQRLMGPVCSEDASGRVLSYVERYSFASDQWELISALHTARTGASACAVRLQAPRLVPDSQGVFSVRQPTMLTPAIVVAGGWDGFNHLKSVEVLMLSEARALGTASPPIEGQQARAPNMPSAETEAAAEVDEGQGTPYNAEQEDGKEACLLVEHQQLACLRDRVERCLKVSHWQRARAIGRGWAWLASQLLACAEETLREAERSEEMQRLAERIAADSAAARAERDGDTGCTAACGDVTSSSPLKERVRVLEQVRFFKS